MRRIFIFFTFLIPFSIACKHPRVNNSDSHKLAKVNGIKIPLWWIEKVQKFNYTRNDSILLKEFDDFIKPNKLSDQHTQHINPAYGRVFNLMSANLDGSPHNEIICMLGWDIEDPSLCVFKQIDGDWYLIYREVINTFYGSPTLYVANCFSKNKTFYLRRVYDHGSGIYIDGYSFYKLIDNKVYKCLDIINNAHIYGWGLYMNQTVRTSFEFSGDDADNINVNYNYNFFPGAVEEGDCSWCANEDISLVKGEDNVIYDWDSKLHQYKLNIPDYKKDTDDLTAQKIACFGDFGNDTLFVSAFHSQIEKTLKTGTLQQKKILKKYLALVKRDKTARTGKLIKTAETGGTSFYKEKK